jgi:hypothetical protein
VKLSSSLASFSLASSVCAAAVLLSAGVLSTGCQSSAVKQSPALKQGADTATAISKSVDLLASARTQITRTTAALRNLTDRPGDTTAQYKVALDEIAKMNADAATISASVATIRAQGDTYLAEWSRKIAAITNPELRDASFVRRGEVAAQLQAMYKSYQEVRAAYTPFLTGIGEIQTVLGTDLSPKGLAAASPFVAKVSADALPLNAALGKLADNFSTVGNSMQPSAE